MDEHSDAQDADELKLSIRATPSSYAALAGFWFVLGGLYLLANHFRGGGGNAGALVSVSVGLLWVVWLMGFRLTVYDTFVVYRDGFYRSVRIARSEISDVRSAWAEWTLLGRQVRIPRLVIDYGVGGHLIVNPKPFARRDVGLAIELMRRKTSGSC